MRNNKRGHHDYDNVNLTNEKSMCVAGVMLYITVHFATTALQKGYTYKIFLHKKPILLRKRQKI